MISRGNMTGLGSLELFFAALIRQAINDVDFEYLMCPFTLSILPEMGINEDEWKGRVDMARQQTVRLYAVRYDKKKNEIDIEYSDALPREKNYRLKKALQVTNGRNVIPFSHPLVAESPQMALSLFREAMIKRIKSLKIGDPKIARYEQILKLIGQ